MKKHLPKINRIGNRYGRLKVIGYHGYIKSGTRRKYRWLCKCDCGNHKITTGENLNQGKTKSCGCLNMENLKKRGKHSNGWKGGVRMDNGYIQILKRSHPNSKRGYIHEHRYIMSKHLGRPLYDDEIVHHKNGIKTDNRIENLELWSKTHPYGKRIEDLVSFSLEILKKYASEKLSDEV